MQGLVLNHPSSKAFVGRKWSLEVHPFHLDYKSRLADTVTQILLDLLLTSRYLCASCPTLSSTIIDTLLCVLVDNSSGLRAFEDVNGLQAVVKILKRAGTPREVR